MAWSKDKGRFEHRKPDLPASTLPEGDQNSANPTSLAKGATKSIVSSVERKQETISVARAL
jgi:hypothetical protein